MPVLPVLPSGDPAVVLPEEPGLLLPDEIVVFTLPAPAPVESAVVTAAPEAEPVAAADGAEVPVVIAMPLEAPVVEAVLVAMPLEAPVVMVVDAAEPVVAVEPAVEPVVVGPSPVDPTPPGQVSEDAFATPDALAAMLAAINLGPADPGVASRVEALEALGLDTAAAVDAAAFDAALRGAVLPDADDALAQWSTDYGLGEPPAETLVQLPDWVL